MAKSFLVLPRDMARLDPTVRAKTGAFYEKLRADDSAPGLHIEPIKNSIDPRVRTGRVDLQYRAVMFRLDGADGPSYIVHGIWNHDDAIKVAQRAKLKVNPVNGLPEVIEATAPEESYVRTPSPVITEPAAVAAPVPAPTSAPAPTHHRPEWALTATREELVEGLGFEADLADRALACADEDAILELAGQFVDWRSTALLELGTGATVAEVKDRLDITDAAPTDDSDQAILDSLRQPASQGSFTFIESNEELRRIIEEGDFGAWRVWLHPEQRKYATRDYNGPFRLSGGAGTGKTVVLLHRARRLAKANPQARIVLTTFTTNLADALARDLDRLDPDLPRAQELGDPGVLVRGVDALAYAVIKSAGSEISAAVGEVLGAPSAHVQQRTAGDAWNTAIATAGSDLSPALHTPHFFQAEYEAVVLPGHITAETDYLRVRRPGRGVRLNRKERTAVWRVIEAYRASSRIEGMLDYAEAATVAAAHLAQRAAEGKGYWADHLLVDEGQDLSPAHWQLLRALVGEGPNDLFIAEDSHQRIYGHKLVLGQYGIRIVGRSQRLTLNYRTTAENLHFALGVLEGGTYADLEDQPEETSRYHSSRRGPVPKVIACGTMTEELDVAADLVRSWADKAAQEGPGAETIAILVRDQFQRERVISGLGERGVDVRPVDREAVKPGSPVAMTMHRAKGTEFSKVLLFGMSEKSIPKIVRGAAYSDDEKLDSLLRERSLLYVAASRARDELVVTWSGGASELLPSLTR